MAVLSRVMARVVLVTALAGPAAVAAQTLSPGPLGKAHEDLEGLSNCTKCHEFGQKLDGKLCLECHTTLRRYIDAKRGMHPRQLSDHACMDCHKEHRGENASLTDWGGSKDQFQHKRTGWPLEGKHSDVKCDKCHQPQALDDTSLRKQFAKGQHTYLGLSRSCSGCHFDEHRGQLKGSCDKCHDSRSFKKVTKFDHDDFWRLRGAHDRAACTKCHSKVADPKSYAEGTFPKPMDPERFVRYAPTPKNCVNCHKDPHEGSFGTNCQKCHTERSWQDTRMNQGAPTFHDNTDFPLIGKHTEVECATCHPPGKSKGGIQLKGFPHKHCVDCHQDAHYGQLPVGEDGVLRCDKCHDEEGFSPSSFPLVEHQRTRYPLEGSHVSVPCNECHKDNKEALAKFLPRKKPDPKRALLVSAMMLHMPSLDVKQCESCHKDQHGGQFGAGWSTKACAACHDVNAFKDVALDHNRDTRYPLLGRHQGVACGACHAAPRAAEPIQYRGVPTECSACHTDVHRGQFQAPGDTSTACDKCHSVEGFAPTAFNHQSQRFTDFTLRGAHLNVACNKCHPTRTLPDGRVSTWFKGVPRTCQGCHVNVHDGSAP